MLFRHLQCAQVSYFPTAPVGSKQTSRFRRLIIQKECLLFAVAISFLSLVLFCSAESNGQQPQWVWASRDATQSVPAEQCYFRKVFSVESPKSAQIAITCDNGYILFVNGRLVGKGTEWNSPTAYDATAVIKSGKNVVAILGANEAEGPAGLVCKIELKTGNSTETIVTDKPWKVSKVAANGWRNEKFNDSKWKPAVELGNLNKTAPWGRIDFANAKSQVIAGNKSRNSEALEFASGTRITFLGGTYIERLQLNNYFESLVSTSFPDRDLTFRNLGWSGDDVLGTSRAVFGSRAQGFVRLENDLLLTEPDLVILNYGRNEAFGGKSQLGTFMNNLERLVDTCHQAGAAVILVSPMRLQDLGAPLPSVKDQNSKIKMYCDAIQEFALSREIPFVDFYSPLGKDAVSKTAAPAIRDRITDNGMHLNPYGYWRTAIKLGQKLSIPRSTWNVQIELSNKSFVANGTLVSRVDFDGISFSALDDNLPYSSPPKFSPRGAKLVAPHDRLQISGLPEGHYGLNIDGKPTLLATSEQWAKGVFVNRAKYIAQVEDLRQAIGKKNELFFHRYRPQNETYLFLFRKHEQGNNAVEIPQFDPLIKEQEKIISKLRQPKIHTYKLVKVDAPPEPEILIDDCESKLNR